MEATGLAVRARGLRKSYGRVEAVRGVDLEIPPGEVFALLGPNGAGKTTTVEILEGYRHRDGGEVSVLGTDPQHADRAWRARIGIVLQLASDAPELTVAEMISHFAGFYPSPRPPAEVIDLVGLTDKARSRIAALSGGQQRRLDVALGLIGRPELLFLDEPTTGFDPEARRAFWEVIRVLSGSGVTVLLTTHYLDEAAALADRVAVISGGVIVAEGAPADLGGQLTAEAVVSWQDHDGRQSQRTAEPTAMVASLATRYGGEVPGLTVTRPSLEDVYLELIGGRP
ncbi:MAG TPA: ABC transporter ATP-binding protein [Trebonia sp.]|nr:ABC transporter ATP-binding protein [Trebonia sp.]